jgi:hypothetical protein
MELTRSTSAGGSLSTSRFVPEQGHHYSVTQSAAIDSTNCPMHIVDDATKAAPPSARHDFHGYCPGM